jgi:hypothetical protein
MELVDVRFNEPNVEDGTLNDVKGDIIVIK